MMDGGFAATGENRCRAGACRPGTTGCTALAGSRANAWRPAGAEGLHQNDVVLFLVVPGFHLQRNAFSDKIAQHRQVLRLFFEEQVDHFLRRQNAKFARVELFCLAHQFAQDFVADGARGFDLPLAAAGGAGFAQDMGQRFARAFARHLDQAQRREVTHRDLGAVARQRFFQLGQHGVLVLVVTLFVEMSMKLRMMMPSRLPTAAGVPGCCKAFVADTVLLFS